METKQEILKLVDEYVERYPEQKEEAEPLIRFLHTHEGTAIIDRKNFNGHITTSAFIVDKNANAVLLLKHKSLNRWLQPGGHADPTDASLIASAAREATEETGLPLSELSLLSGHIFDIDSHAIPKNSKKREPAHIHHDIRFLFEHSGARTINISLEESTDSGWVPFAELKGDADFGGVIKKIEAALKRQ